MDDVNALDLAFGWLNAYAIASVTSSLSSSLVGLQGAVFRLGWVQHRLGNELAFPTARLIQRWLRSQVVRPDKLFC